MREDGREALAEEEKRPGIRLDRHGENFARAGQRVTWTRFGTSRIGSGKDFVGNGECVLRDDQFDRLVP